MDIAATIEQIQDAVRGHQRVRVTAGGSKPALSADANLSLAGVSGVSEYEPSEYTFTALAGTPIAEVEKLLAQHGQYLPFDPPLARAGATLGGTVAAGLSGPGRFRYGGVRDFVLGVRFVSGRSELVRGGGKVVKNAAGFEIPKLMVGGLGHFGIMVELSFKVFPAPESYATAGIDFSNTDSAVDAMMRLAASPFDLACLDLEPPSRLWVRVGGRPKSLAKRLERLKQGFGADREFNEMPAHREASFWEDVREFSWVPESCGLVKIPLVPSQIAEFESIFQDVQQEVPRRYSVAGNVAWVAWPKDLPASKLERVLSTMGRTGVALRGRWASKFLGEPLGGDVFAKRLLRVFDPDGKFSVQAEPAHC